MVTLCLEYTGKSATEVETGFTPPFTRYSAWDETESSRLIVFPTSLNEKQRVIPSSPTGRSWPMNERYLELESALLTEVSHGDELCGEYAILTLSPSEDGYPDGTYFLKDSVSVRDDETYELELSVDVEDEAIPVQ